jgi:succinyl-CoA synthetase beta subunit
MASPEGGVEIEEVASKSPERIKKLAIDPFLGIFDFQARELAFFLTSDFTLVNQIATFIKNLYRCFIASDASLAEINPLVVTAEGKVVALDAKMNFDDNGLYRHSEFEELRDDSEEGLSAAEARQMGLSYIPLDGDIACVVNGAGLAMCTMDLIKYYGGEPANFLDIGGSSNPAKVTTAMKIIRQQGQAKALLFNIFGGITRCDDVAAGIKEAFADRAPEIPIVCRLTGTNEERAKEIMESIGIATLTDMDEAVQKVVALAKGK